MAYADYGIYVYVDNELWSEDTVSLYVGADYTPSAHIPTHPSGTEFVSIYSYDYATGSYTQYNTGSFKAKSTGGTVDFYFETSAPPWTIASTITLGDAFQNISRSLSIGNMTLHRFSVDLLSNHPGTISVYTTGSADTVGWVSFSSALASAYTGEPIEYDYYDDDSGSGNNFKIQFNNTQSRRAYIFVRTYNGDSGSCTLHIDIPELEWTVDSYTSLGSIGTPWSTSHTFSQLSVYRVAFSLQNGGWLNVSANAELFLSNSSSFDASTGEPDTILESGYGEIDYWGDTGVTYYLFIRLTNKTDSGSRSITITPPAGSFQVTFNHYYKGEIFNATIVSIRAGTTITLYDYRDTMFGAYIYSYGTRAGSTEHITQAVISAASTFNLYYTEQSGIYTIEAVCNGNCKQVSITANGQTVTSPENGACRMTIPDGTDVTVNYIGYTGTSSTWYKFFGWYSSTSGGGTQYSDRRQYSFAMPSEDRKMYAYAVTQYSAFSWTYRGMNPDGTLVTGTTKQSGLCGYVSALEWNDLWKYIEARKNRYISHTKAVSGFPLTHDMYNEVVTAIGTGSTVIWGQVLTAALLNALVTNARNL